MSGRLERKAFFAIFYVVSHKCAGSLISFKAVRPEPDKELLHKSLIRLKHLADAYNCMFNAFLLCVSFM